MRGGKRPGAGRRKNKPNRASAAREREAQATGLTPCDVLLGVMREFWKLANSSTNARKRVDHLRSAAAIARDAAPYFHARIATTTVPDDRAPHLSGAREVVRRLEITGGLPRGSTPEKPEGDDYSDVPPCEEVR
jgi:hypothetical protein